jgi:hypothetical protein
MKKIALAAAVIVGTATAAFAEDSSASFGINVYAQGAQQYRVLEGRDVALTGAPAAIARTQVDRASNPSAGGGF